MEQDLLVEAYEVLLGEAPVDDIGESPFGPGYRNVPGYRPGNKWQDENYRAVQGRGW